MSSTKAGSPAIRDAATILLLREGSTGVEVFMVRRGKTAQFMAQAMVFPGGRLDPADCSDTLASRCSMTRAQAAERLCMTDGRHALGLLIAGARETFEEAGVLLATRAGVAVGLSEGLTAGRDALNAKTLSFEAFLEAEDLCLDLGQLRYMARWVTPTIERRRYDARFFITRAPRDQRALHDDIENSASAWLTAAEALSGHERGQLQLAPPTLRVLMGLAEAPTIEAALTLRGHSLSAAYLPQAAHVGDSLHLLFPGDLAFDPPGGVPNRVTLRDGRWHTDGVGF